MLPGSPQFEAALEILKTLRTAGYEAYLAGGCVRDLLLGREPEDYDVATSATPDIVLDMFPRTFAVGAHFGVVLVASEIGGACKEGAVDERCVTEVATFRSDGVYSDGRHPDAVSYTKSAAGRCAETRLHDQWIAAGSAAAFPGSSGSCNRLCWRPRRSRCGCHSRHRSAREYDSKKISFACCVRFGLPRALDLISNRQRSTRCANSRPASTR